MSMSVVPKLIGSHLSDDESSIGQLWEKIAYPSLFTNLAGDYRLGKISSEIGTNALRDYGDNANHGAYADDRWFPKAWTGCADLRGLTAKIACANHASNQDVFAGAGSVGFWMLLDVPSGFNFSLYGPRVIRKSHETSTTVHKDGWAVWCPAGSGDTYKVGFSHVYDIDTAKAYHSTSSADLTIGTWHHVVIVFNGTTPGTIAIYIDGAAVATTDNSTGSPTTIDSDSASNVNMAWHNDTERGAQCYLSEVFLHAGSLSAADVSNIYLGAYDMTTLDNYWPLNDVNYPTADATNNGAAVGALDGTVTVGTSALMMSASTASPDLYYQDFDGVDDEIRITSHSSVVDLFASGGTMSAWINADSDGEEDAGRIVDKRDGGNYRCWVSDESGGFCKVNFFVPRSVVNGNWATTAAVVPIGADTHVSVVYDASSTANDPVIYINGSSVAVTENTTPDGTVTADTGGDLIIGNRHSPAQSKTFDGKIWNVALDKIAYTAAQVSDLYTYGIYPRQPAALYRLDEPSSVNGYANTGDGGAGAGTQSGGVTPTTGRPAIAPIFNAGVSLKKGIYCNGHTVGAYISDHADLNWGSGDGAVMGAFSTTEDGISVLGSLASKGGFGSGEASWTLYVSSSTDKLILHIDDGTNTATVGGLSAINDGEWHTFLAQRNGSNVEIYVDDDAVQTASAATVGDIDKAGSGLVFGALLTSGVYSGFLPCVIADLRVFTAAKTQADYQNYRNMFLNGF